MELVYGNEKISETLLGLSFDIGPKSFFQTNSQGAQVLYSLVRDFAKKSFDIPLSEQTSSSQLSGKF